MVFEADRHLSTRLMSAAVQLIEGEPWAETIGCRSGHSAPAHAPSQQAKSKTVDPSKKKKKRFALPIRTSTPRHFHFRFTEHFGFVRRVGSLSAGQSMERVHCPTGFPFLNIRFLFLLAKLAFRIASKSRN